ncbi:MAG TPA: SMC family ATPase [Kineosporiaceae bacterium]|nr:SMC family ATPase [Kineosporiaceae bacterium]
MRPVRLDMTGFASFREAAVVDFTDADYFALVGPTGSGKSTVIDAMTFALYGSAPRWGKVNAIADALAPTTNRCTVRLVFDLGPTRYVVAREVRRSGKNVLQKNVILERLIDPTGTGADGEESEVIAGDLKEVNRSIEKLLGLSFSDFCQCVVLPQGQFAEFLKATPKDRQEILLKLLGAGHYEAIAKSATARAALAGEKAAVLAAQLGNLAEATEAAELAARDRETKLAQLASAVDQALPLIAERAARVETATAQHQRLTDELARLTSEQRPEGIAGLQAGLDAADRERVAALELETATVAADTQARAALAAGPSRSELESTIAQQQEFSRLIGRRPVVAEAADSTAARQLAAQARVQDADRTLAAVLDRRDQARQEQAEAAGRHETLLQRRSALASVRVPDGVDVLASRTLTTRQAVAAARGRREAAEVADQDARDALRQAPARGPLEQARHDLAEQQLTRERVAGLERRHTQLQAARTAAASAAQQAQDGVTQARQRYEKALEARTAATLRPHLVPGDACPVCEQTVVTLPAPLETSTLDAAKREVSDAEKRLLGGQRALVDATAQVASNEAEIRSAHEYLDKLTAALSGQPTDVGAVVEQLSRLDALAAALESAAAELAAARTAERAAIGALDELGQQTAAARTQLISAHGPLIGFGAPALDDSDLPAAWAALIGWAAGQIEELDLTLLPAAHAAATSAKARHADAVRALQEAETERQAAQLQHTESVRVGVRATEELRALTSRLTELETTLVQAPTAEEAAVQLAECSRLEVAAKQCDEQLRTARTARVAAEEARAQWNARADQARRQLRAARDRLVPLGAPELADAHLAGAWSELLTWAQEQADRRREQVPAVAEQIELATREHQIEVRALRALVADQAVELADEPPAVLPARMATALERARSETRSIAEKRSRAASLTDEMADSREQQQVAKLLADLLRFDKFPRWLAAAALDTLVADASVALSDLSGGQFDLSHDRGDFVVIDHADADSRRSVRTLSGGETFQASLALALALSAQLSTLAAEGAARLDSIFLDEGFGTLDAETLEVVAGTLENLAHGERMVGVITHVAALAERAPVRFAVHRDSRTSTIQREVS